MTVQTTYPQIRAVKPLASKRLLVTFATGEQKVYDCTPLLNGNITLFANGINTTTNPFSRVIELDPRTHKAVWEYRAKPAYTFFSPHISGAQRMSTGNTLICEGQWGRLFEVTAEGEIVWEYVSPFMGPDRAGLGDGPRCRDGDPLPADSAATASSDGARAGRPGDGAPVGCRRGRAGRPPQGHRGGRGRSSRGSPLRRR